MNSQVYYDINELTQNGIKGPLIHIRRKHLVVNNHNDKIEHKKQTHVEGINDIFDKQKLLEVLRKECACGGSVVPHPIYGEIIMLQGDHTIKVGEFFEITMDF